MYIIAQSGERLSIGVPDDPNTSVSVALVGEDGSIGDVTVENGRVVKVTFKNADGAWVTLPL